MLPNEIESKMQWVEDDRRKLKTIGYALWTIVVILALTGKWITALITAVILAVGGSIISYFKTRQYIDKLGMTQEEFFSYWKIYKMKKVHHSRISPSSKENVNIAELKTKLKNDPNDSETLCKLGQVYTKMGQHDEAIGVLKKAIDINKEDAKAHFTLGIVYSNLGQISESKKSFQKAGTLRPNDAELHFTLGCLYIMMRDEEEAIKEHKILIAIDPERADKLHKLLMKSKK